MKWYVAARRSEKETVKSLLNILKEHGHQITYDWTELEKIKPYKKNIEICKNIAYDISLAVKDTGVFVLISGASGTDMFVELGIAIYTSLNKKKIQIYVVGNHNKRSLMHLHPSIIHKQTLEEVLMEEGVTIPKGKLKVHE